MQEPASKTPRGIRLNNPGNIRHGRDQWQGAAADQPDESFVKFEAPVYGIRAIARLMLTYSRKGYDTPREIIGRWAPDTENDTEAYIAHVASALGAEPDDVLNVDSVAVMLPLIKAIIKHENGRQPYSDALIREALVKAGVSDAKPKALLTSGEFQAKAGAAALTACATVASYAQPLADASNAVQPFAGSPIIQHLSTVLMTLAGVAALAAVAVTVIKRKPGL